MELGDKLKAIRKSKRLSLKELSEKTKGKVSLSFLSDIENGRGNPSIDSLKIIANALNAPISYFVDDSQNSVFNEAIEDIEFIPIVELLRDFKDWDIEDKKELIYYLKAKKTIRDSI
ncbi:helix-turn-helix transcriptional regulator [Clostridium sp. C8-1-8]|jgi:transcriptional regulator with XRE-family HTH domain|uniref:helix-turn-helix domain-containing protein n=1 Tax=Clostridium sp. C8-1-8 TaxID=2698831 RepID=UPI001FACE691|nr:helix-turn-helix transcriptional regulator [Clostridium sp. C8-1-8]